jgi:hypothetical protein
MPGIVFCDVFAQDGGHRLVWGWVQAIMSEFLIAGIHLKAGTVKLQAGEESWRLDEY